MYIKFQKYETFFTGSPIFKNLLLSEPHYYQLFIPPRFPGLEGQIELKELLNLLSKRNDPPLGQAMFETRIKYVNDARRFVE